jgi:hypothetical protein
MDRMIVTNDKGNEVEIPDIAKLSDADAMDFAMLILDMTEAQAASFVDVCKRRGGDEVSES